MSKLRLILGRLLMVWGVVSLIGVVMFGGVITTMLSRMMPSGKGPSVDTVQPSEVAFVLSWGEIGDRQNIDHVVHSYVSDRLSLDGDHFNAFCIQVKSFPDGVESRGEFEKTWYRGPIESPIFKSAVESALRRTEHWKLTWFPSLDVVNSSRCLLFFNTIKVYDGWRVEYLQLTIYDTETKLLYFVEFKI